MQLQARCERKGNRERTRKKKVHQERQVNPLPLISRRAMPQEIHMRLMHPPDCSHYRCTWRDTCVFKHTSKAGEDKHGNATIAILLEEADEFKCVLKRPNSEFDIVAMPKDAYSREKQ